MGLEWLTNWGIRQKATWEKLQRGTKGTKCRPPSSSVSPPFCLSITSWKAPSNWPHGGISVWGQ